jgi:SAM-dependent methyltransferase
MSDAITPNQIHMQALWRVRKYELNIALGYFPPVSETQPCKVLELGSGTGQQAQYLTERGYNVLALDLPSSSYREARVFDIQEYDGENLPANDNAFDVVFSSNVLEHVINIDKVLLETYRVLKSGGIAVHLVPSPSCRGWSIFAHYIWLFRRIFSRIFVKKSADSHVQMPRTPQSSKEWLGTFFPLRHGERGNTLTEMYYFSERYWLRKFEEHGFKIKMLSNNSIFYTMANAIGTLLPLKTREKLAFFLGSSCNIYVIEKI